MKVRLYVIPASHPAMAAQLILKHKGIPYDRTDLMPGIHKGVLRALRFPGNTVPAMKVDGRRVQGSRAIARELDRLQPEPPLFPDDPEQRTAVEEAERFGDEDLQAPVRRILWNAIKRDRSMLRSYSEGARLGIPVGLAVRTAAPIVAAAVAYNKASDENVRADLAALPGMLNRIDDWCRAGVLNGEQLNAADFQIAPSLRLAMTLEDLRPAIERRPAGEMAMRVAPDYPGQAPPILPAAWLEPLREQVSA
ncbi:MAG: glutathione S-transferase N-terminal domain-containing protein [Actinomycetota bacterium]